MNNRQCEKQTSGCEIRALGVDCDSQGMINYEGERILCSSYIPKQFVPTEFTHRPDDVLVTCPSCESYTRFTFLGIQEDETGQEAFPLYKCSCCFTSKGLRGLL